MGRYEDGLYLILVGRLFKGTGAVCGRFTHKSFGCLSTSLNWKPFLTLFDTITIFFFFYVFWIINGSKKERQSVPLAAYHKKLRGKV